MDSNRRKIEIYSIETHNESSSFHKWMQFIPLGKLSRVLSRNFLLIVLFLISIFILYECYKDGDLCDDVMDDCNGVPLNDTVLPPFVDYLQDFVVAPKVGIAHCILPKVLSTISSAALCYLNNPDEFKRANRSISKENYVNRFCPNLERDSFKQVEKHLNNLSSNVMIVRNPYDRFISGFIDKCVNLIAKNLCHNCGYDIHCFLRTEYRRMKKFSWYPLREQADTHFAPQSWYCDMKNNMKTSTIIKYGSTKSQRKRMIQDYANFFRKNKVPEMHVEEISREMAVGKSHHTTSGSPMRTYYEKLIRSDEKIRRAIQRLYYYDFEIFGYNM